MNKIRVRIAPSPTGNLHVGTARAALFNYLFARHHGGTFIIRIEDTDKQRSQPVFEQNILEGLQWLGMTWEEGPDKGGAYGPYRQSERTEHYARAITQLLETDKAYVDEASNNVIRLRVPAQTVTFTDLIRGEVTVHSDTWGGDFVIARSPEDPVFHLAVVVDDAAQLITHVIRGEDHISNTPRHILIQQALGLLTPAYAHVPLLLDEQRHKLSKRKNAVSLSEYRAAGYLPHTMLNYLALLGWNPKTDQEFFTADELVRSFDLSGIQKGGAIFSVTKLNAVNKQYLRQLTPAELLSVAEPFMRQQGMVITDATYWQQALATEQTRVNTVKELAAAVTFFQPDWPGDYVPETLIWKKSTSDQTKQLLQQLIDFLTAVSEADFSVATLEQKIVAWIDEHTLGRGDTLWPMRVALTGKEHSPGPFEVAAVLGKKMTLARLEAALAKLD